MSRARAVHLHALVLIALAMVLTTDVLGWSWLPAAFPATGVLFAAGGAALAALRDRTETVAGFYRAALLRLLAPLWLLAAVVLPVLLAHGWRAEEDLGSARLTWGNAWLWVFPLADPPVSTSGIAATAGLWFVRAWLWFLLLTPPLLWVFRRWPVRLIAVPVVTLALVTSGLATLEGTAAVIVVGLGTYACCWLLGFGYSDGSLTRLPLAPTLVGGAVLVAAGLRAAVALKAQYFADSLADVPVAAMLVSTGGALVLLRLQPAFARLARLRRTSAALATVDRRIVTTVLWAGVVAAVTPAVRERLHLAPAGPLAEYGTAGALLAGVLLLIGWVEALAAVPRWPRLPWFLRWSGRPAFVPRRRYVLEDNVAADLQQPVP